MNSRPGVLNPEHHQHAELKEYAKKSAFHGIPVVELSHEELLLAYAHLVKSNQREEMFQRSVADLRRFNGRVAK